MSCCRTQPSRRARSTSPTAVHIVKGQNLATILVVILDLDLHDGWWRVVFVVIFGPFWILGDDVDEDESFGRTVCF
jgi:hypothetical protein